MPLRDDLLNPIPGDNPSGAYLYYAPIYDKIKEARRQEDAPGPSGVWARERKAADWNLVIKLAGEALATQSKDVQLAVWLAEAYFKKEGFPPSAIPSSCSAISSKLPGIPAASELKGPGQAAAELIFEPIH